MGFGGVVSSLEPPNRRETAPWACGCQLAVVRVRRVSPGNHLPHRRVPTRRGLASHIWPQGKVHRWKAQMGLLIRFTLYESLQQKRQALRARAHGQIYITTSPPSSDTASVAGASSGHASGCGRVTRDRLARFAGGVAISSTRCRLDIRQVIPGTVGDRRVRTPRDRRPRKPPGSLRLRRDCEEPDRPWLVGCLTDGGRVRHRRSTVPRLPAR